MGHAVRACQHRKSIDTCMGIYGPRYHGIFWAVYVKSVFELVRINIKVPRADKENDWLKAIMSAIYPQK